MIFRFLFSTFGGFGAETMNFRRTSGKTRVTLTDLVLLLITTTHNL